MIRFRATDEEARMVQELADRNGQTMSDWIRLLIRREHAKLQKPLPARPKQSRKGR